MSPNLRGVAADDARKCLRYLTALPDEWQAKVVLWWLSRPGKGQETAAKIVRRALKEALSESA